MLKSVCIGEQALAEPGLQRQRGSAGSIGVSSGRASPPLSRFALEPQPAVVTSTPDTPQQAPPLQA